MTFRHVAIITSCLFLALAGGWMFSAEHMLSQWGVEYSDAAGLVGRRAAAFYLGFAMMFFMARNTPHSTSRMALIKGMMTTCTILILLGVYEFLAGHASNKILIAALIEAVVGLAFFYIWRTSNKTHNHSNNVRINQ